MDNRSEVKKEVVSSKAAVGTETCSHQVYKCVHRDNDDNNDATYTRAMHYSLTS